MGRILQWGLCIIAMQLFPVIKITGNFNRTCRMGKYTGVKQIHGQRPRSYVNQDSGYPFFPQRNEFFCQRRMYSDSGIKDTLGRSGIHRNRNPLH